VLAVLKRGVAQEPPLGAALAAAEQVWIVAGFPNDHAALDAIVEEAMRAKTTQK
jgi:hypothetical protein